MTITKQDIAAFRQANDISFFCSENGHKIIASKDTPDDPFDSCKTRHVEVSGNLDAKRYQGYASINSSRHSSVWQTVVSLMRPGDHLHLDWLRDYHSNLYVRVASGKEGAQAPDDSSYGALGSDYYGLHADVLKLKIFRPMKNGKTKVLTFDVDHSICPDNTARMIREIPGAHLRLAS